MMLEEMGGKGDITGGGEDRMSMGEGAVGFSPRNGKFELLNIHN